MLKDAICMLVGGEVPQSGILVLTGIIVLIIICSVFLGFYLQIKSARKQTQSENDDKMSEEREKIRREVELERTLTDLKSAVEKMTENVKCINDKLNDQVSRIEKTQESHGRLLVKLIASFKAMHKRMDDHRRIDHKINEHPMKDTEEYIHDLETEEDNVWG